MKLQRNDVQRGVILPTLPFVLILMLCILALAIDLSWCYSEKNNLQHAADAAALTAAMQLRENKHMNEILDASQRFALNNESGAGNILRNADIRIGHWDAARKQFLTSGSPNAVQVVARRDGQASSAQISTFFMGFFGFNRVATHCAATATFKEISANADLLFDDDSFHKDLPEIIQLARNLRTSPEALTSDRNRDGFVDIPPNIELTLPAGSPGHPGLFEVGKDFPFGSGKEFTLREFLTTGTAIQSKHVPAGNVPTVRPVGDQTLASLPRLNPYIGVIFEKDIHTKTETVKGKTVYSADLNIKRSGLIAFEIKNVITQPNNRSQMRIKVVDPKSVNLNTLGRRYELRPVVRVN